MSEPDAAQPGSLSDETLVPLDALEAAWQAVEAVVDEGGGPEPPAPDTPDDPQAQASQTPAENLTAAPAEVSAQDAPPPTQQEPDPPAAQADMPKSGKRGRGMRFVVGKRARAEAAGSAGPARESSGTKQSRAAGSPAATQPEVPAPAAAAAQPAKQVTAKPAAGPAPFLPRVPWWKRLLRALDDLLDVVNRPFARLSPEVRSLIGVVSLTTVAISLTSAWLIPTLLPHRDAISFLEEARARVLVRPQPADAPADAPPGGVSADKGGG